MGPANILREFDVDMARIRLKLPAAVCSMRVSLAVK
jgi:hypothetical protein